MITRSDLRNATLAIVSAITFTALWPTIWQTHDQVVRTIMAVAVLGFLALAVACVNNIGRKPHDEVGQESTVIEEEPDVNETPEGLSWFARVMELQNEIEMAARTFNMARLGRVVDDLKTLVAEEQER